jgi:hypothetical protein
VADFVLGAEGKLVGASMGLNFIIRKQKHKESKHNISNGDH